MPRRGENIYRRKDGRWEGRYIKEKIGNKAKYGYVYAHSYQEVTLRKGFIAGTIIFRSCFFDFDINSLIDN